MTVRDAITPEGVARISVCLDLQYAKMAHQRKLAGPVYHVRVSEVTDDDIANCSNLLNIGAERRVHAPLTVA